MPGDLSAELVPPETGDESDLGPQPLGRQRLVRPLATVGNQKLPTRHCLTRFGKARRSYREIEVGASDHRDSGHSRSRNVERKRSACTAVATRQFGWGFLVPALMSARDIPRVN